MLDWVENRLLVRGLKYWAHSCSQFYKLNRENTHPEKMCDIVFEKAKGHGGRSSFYVEAAVGRVLWKRCHV